jgi:transposase-like protein
VVTRIDCPFCGRIGSLSSERVIKGDQALTTYSCQSCGREWDEREEERRRHPRPRVAARTGRLLPGE